MKKKALVFAATALATLPALAAPRGAVLPLLHPLTTLGSLPSLGGGGFGAGGLGSRAADGGVSRGSSSFNSNGARGNDGRSLQAQRAPRNEDGGGDRNSGALPGLGDSSFGTLQGQSRGNGERHATTRFQMGFDSQSSAQSSGSSVNDGSSGSGRLEQSGQRAMVMTTSFDHSVSGVREGSRTQSSSGSTSGGPSGSAAGDASGSTAYQRDLNYQGSMTLAQVGRSSGRVDANGNSEGSGSRSGNALQRVAIGQSAAFHYDASQTTQGSANGSAASTPGNSGERSGSANQSRATSTDFGYDYANRAQRRSDAIASGSSSGAQNGTGNSTASDRRALETFYSHTADVNGSASGDSSAASASGVGSTTTP